MQKYLITSSSVAHVNLDIILGISKTKDGIIEILWNYTLFNKKYLMRTFEDEITVNEVNIYKISEKDFQYLDNLYSKYNFELEEQLTRYGYKYSAVIEFFWYGIYESESYEQNFTKSECKRIKKIIERSTKALDT